MKLINESLNEKFSQGEDKLKTLGIGWRHSIENVLKNYNVYDIIYKENTIVFDCELHHVRDSPIKIKFCLDGETLRSANLKEITKYIYPTSIKTANDLIEAIDNFYDDWIDRSYIEKFNWNW